MKANSIRRICAWRAIAARVLAGICLALMAFSPCLAESPAAGPGATAQPDFAEIDRYVAAELARLHLPGAALVIVHDRDVVHVRGFGIADPSGRPVTAQTPFLLGSSTKSFTALATMQLVEAGRLDLDAPVQRYLPWFSVADPAASAAITVRQLLNQTSGLTTYTGRKGLDRDDAPDALERSVRGLASAKLNGPPGSRYEYGNANYATLGLLIEQVSGQGYDAYMQAHVFGPLDMQRTFTSREAARAAGLAMGYRLWLGRPLPFAASPWPHRHVPTGYIAASAEDMGHYLVAQLNGGQYDGRSITSPEGMAAMHSPAAFMIPDTYYGMGWAVRSIDGNTIVTHTGDLSDFHSEMYLAPAGRWGVALLFNANTSIWPGVSEIFKIAPEVTRRVSGLPMPDAPTQPAAMFVVLMSLAVAILLVEILLAALSIRRLRRWWNDPARRPGTRLGLVRVLALPLLPDLVVAGFYLLFLPAFSGSPLGIALVYQPDLGVLIVAGLVLAIGWAPLRTILGVAALRNSAGQPHRGRKESLVPRTS